MEIICALHPDKVMIQVVLITNMEVLVSASLSKKASEGRVKSEKKALTIPLLTLL